MQPISAVDPEVTPVLSVLSLAPDAMFAVNERSRIIFWNEAMRRLFGYESHEVMTRACSTVLAGEDCHGNRYCSEACPILQIAKRDEPVRQFSLSLRLKNGRPHAFEITVLKFVLATSHRFVLVHVVKPAASQSVSAPTVSRMGTASAPRSLAEAVRSSGDVRLRDLTRRECEVLGMLASGFKPADIAHQLCISPVTARNHVQKVLEKLEVHSQTEAVAFVYRTGLM